MSANTMQAMKLLSSELTQFIGVSQRKALISALMGEEAEFFADTLIELARRIELMPGTYDTDGGEMKEKVVHLHYFLGSFDAWIIEKDRSPDGRQLQAFGYASLTGGMEEAELGYINLPEITLHGAELDLYWTPKKVSKC